MEPQINANLNIDLSFEKKSVKYSLQKLSYSSCKYLGKRLTPGKGPFGFGFFNSVKCYLDTSKSKKKTKKRRKSVKQPKHRNSSYHLRILVGESLEFKLIKSNESVFYKDTIFTESNSKIIYEKSFDAGESFDEVFENKELLDAISLHILTHLPALINLDGRSGVVQSDKILGKAETDGVFEDLEPPPKLSVFNLYWRPSSRLWGIESVGEAKKLSEEKKEKLLNSRESEAETPVWGFKGNTKIFDELVNTYAGLHPVYASWIDKVDKVLTELSEEVIDESEQTILALTNSVTSLIGGTIASGYVGFRFGIPVLPGAIFIEKSRFFGLLAEFRSGIFDGLRIYIDHWPEVKETVDGQAAEFGGTRAIVAWALQMDLPWMEGLRFDITPKIGQWTFKSILPISLPNSETGETETRSVGFEIDNSLSLGIESGVEYATSTYLLRTWAAQDFGQSLDQSQVTKVFANRFGVDLHLAVPASLSAGLQLSLLGFGFFEDVTLTKDIDSESLQANDVKADEVGFSQLYLGGGLTVVW